MGSVGRATSGRRVFSILLTQAVLFGKRGGECPEKAAQEGYLRETPLQSTLDALQQPLRSVYPDGGGPAVVTYKRIAW
jgi:hypothetical protein